MQTIIVVHPETGARLCYDNKWRTFANFGGYSSCVKEFKYPRAALKAGERYRGRNVLHDACIAMVVHLNAGDSMDASGKVYRAREFSK